MAGVFGSAQGVQPRHVLVVMPTWLGDCVMATPTLRALRELYPEARISASMRAGLEPMLEPCPFVDRVLTTPERPQAPREAVHRLARRLRSERFSLAVLMAGSFRFAAVTALAGIGYRVGYARDGRSGLLTDRLLPARDRGQFLPMAALEYYLALARYLGAHRPDPAMALFASQQQDREAQALLDFSGDQKQKPGASQNPLGSDGLGHARDGANPAMAETTLDNSLGSPLPGNDGNGIAGFSESPLVLINPGAQKQTKRWPAERFAALADRLAWDQGARIAMTGSPAERAVLDAVIGNCQTSILDLPERGLTLGLLKSVIKGADLLVTGDTGPRHIAAAMNTPVVTLFGPTDPRWTEIDFPKERQIVAPGELATKDDSDQRRPRRHMGLIEVEPVYDAACELLGGREP